MPSRPQQTLISDTRGGVALAGAAFDRITDSIRKFHRAVSGIPFRGLAPLPAVGTGSDVVRAAHDGITGGIYIAVQGIGGAAFALTEAALRTIERNVAAPGDVDPGKRELRDNVAGALNGIFGDYVAASRNSLAVRAGFYRNGAALELERSALAAAYPLASARIAIFVHGLCCNEHMWQSRCSAPAENEATASESRSYGERLAEDIGCTPLYFRYNTGLSVARNGRLLAKAIGQLIGNWPVTVDDIALIGHSMGGLVCRAAAHRGSHTNAAWTAKVSNVICLGSPHLGAPLEKAVHLGVAVMDAFELSRPWARMLEMRSVGIRDLRLGTITDPRDRAKPADVQKIPNARYHFIGASIGQDERDIRGRVLGDGLVRLPSATARRLADTDTAALFGLHHMQLLNHPAVYRELRERLGSADNHLVAALSPKKLPGKARRARCTRGT